MLRHADGSWVVEYQQTAYGSTNGRVLGSYNNDTANPIGPLQYQQPANCGHP